jgi:hypothetical protein
MVMKVFLVEIGLALVCASCMNKQRDAIERELAFVKEHQNMVNQLFKFDLREDSIIGVYIDPENSTSVWRTGQYVKEDIEEVDLESRTKSQVMYYSRLLESVDYYGIERYPNYVKIFRQSKPPFKACYHLRLYTGEYAESEDLVVLSSGIVIKFEPCASI